MDKLFFYWINRNVYGRYLDIAIQIEGAGIRSKSPVTVNQELRRGGVPLSLYT
jgi:hypothetical protein